MSHAAESETAELRRELTATLADFEELTRASVEAEREREEREREVDKLRDAVEQLEAQVAEEKIARMGLRSPGSESNGVTSTGVLRGEFKKMMNDMRADHVKALRVSCLNWLSNFSVLGN